MFRGGVLLNESLITQPGKDNCGRRKLSTVILIVILAMGVAGAGWILYWRIVSSITPILGNVEGQLTGCDYDSSTPLIPREPIPVTPTITNTGNVNMYGFIEVSIPYSTVDGDIVEWYVANPTSGWTQISKSVGESEVSYVFNYGTDDMMNPIEPGSHTSPLFDEGEAGSALTVGPVGLLDASQRSEQRQILFTAYGSQTGGDIEGLNALAAFEAVKSEIGGAP